MNYAGYEPVDMLNGGGVRCSLWVSGCSHGCRGCFNQKAWSYNYGQEFTAETLDLILEDLSRPFIKGLTVLGGEPLDKENIDTVEYVLEKVRDCFGNKKDIVLYTGYLFEEIPEKIKKLVDIVIDGKYDMNQPTTKRYRGSDNQRMWVKKDNIWESD